MPFVRRRGRPELHRPGPPLAAAEHVHAYVGGDSVQPRAHGCPAFETVGRTPRPEHRVLYGVFGLVAGAEHPVAVPGQLAAVCLEFVWLDTGQRAGLRCAGHRCFIVSGPADSRPGPAIDRPRRRTPPPSARPHPRYPRTAAMAAGPALATGRVLAAGPAMAAG